MKLGGIPSAEDAGIIVPRAPEVRERLSSLPDGEVFLPAELFANDEGLLAAFYALRDHDHVAIGAGFHVAIRETCYLRRLPPAQAVMRSWAARFGFRTVEAGDWAACRLGITPWEPMAGCAALSSGPDTHLQMRSIRMRFIHAPDWMLEEGKEQDAMRALLSISEREFASTIENFLRFRSGDIAIIEAGIRCAVAASRTYHAGAPEEDGSRDPAWVDDAYTAWRQSLARHGKKDRKKAGKGGKVSEGMSADVPATLSNPSTSTDTPRADSPAIPA